MFEYTIKATNNDPAVGRINEITLVVTAASEEEAIIRARELALRADYEIIGIKELSREIKKSKG